MFFRSINLFHDFTRMEILFLIRLCYLLLQHAFSILNDIQKSFLIELYSGGDMVALMLKRTQNVHCHCCVTERGFWVNASWATVLGHLPISTYITP